MWKDGGGDRQSTSYRRNSMYGGRTVKMQFSETAGRPGKMRPHREEVGCDHAGSSSLREGLRSLF